ncbi:MAG: hypothetical protein CM1200mP10_12840 [Candidatus Neomarinimicrobiota bacterium]|nr:MAG: hypothetical protein CM1200mP10_12840 [Candidatus Neomarinimicrobiota bacterium]
MSDRTKTMVANQLRKRGINNTAVLDAMSRVPRHRFVSKITVLWLTQITLYLLEMDRQ